MALVFKRKAVCWSSDWKPRSAEAYLHSAVPCGSPRSKCQRLKVTCICSVMQTKMCLLFLMLELLQPNNGQATVGSQDSIAAASPRPETHPTHRNQSPRKPFHSDKASMPIMWKALQMIDSLGLRAWELHEYAAIPSGGPPGLHPLPARRLARGDCKMGEYKEGTGKRSCKDCTPGKYMNEIGQFSLCKSCDPGRYAEQSGSSQCRECSEVSGWELCAA